MKRRIIILLLKCAWAIWREKLIFHMLEQSDTKVSIEFYKKSYFDAMLRMK